MGWDQGFSESHMNLPGFPSIRAESAAIREDTAKEDSSPPALVEVLSCALTRYKEQDLLRCYKMAKAGSDRVVKHDG